MGSGKTETENHAEETFPYPRKCPFSPPEQYEGFIGRNPVSKVQLATGKTAWVISGYDEIRTLLTDRRVRSSRMHPNFPFYFDAPPEFRTDTSFLGFDPPEHTVLRRRVASAFTHRNIRRLRPAVERSTEERIDAMLAAGSPVDLHRELSLAVPMITICELLGVPYEDHEFLCHHGTNLLGGFSAQEDRQRAMVEVGSYLEQLIGLKERDPGDDLISNLLAQYRESSQEYDVRELVHLCRLLINGGYESSAAHISMGVAALLSFPDQLAALKKDPSLLGSAVEEIVRFFSLTDLSVGRVAAEDIEIGGEVIRAGEGILCLLLAGNRDPRQFPQADEFNIDRGSRHHVGFGHGIHRCIGADLARMEIEVVLSRLFQRVPSLKLTQPVEELPFKDRGIVYGPWSLSVSW